MTITTEWRNSSIEGVDVGVRIKKERPNIEELAEAEEDEDNE